MQQIHDSIRGHPESIRQHVNERMFVINLQSGPQQVTLLWIVPFLAARCLSRRYFLTISRHIHTASSRNYGPLLVIGCI